MKFKNLLQLVKYFKDEEVCRKHLEKVFWNNKPRCPHCGCTKAYACRDGKTYKCADKDCGSLFTVTVGTIFENTKIPLQKWMMAIFIFTSHKKGISSSQLARDLGITQKSAWFMLHRIREVMGHNKETVLEEVVEVDETYVGGKQRNKHYNKRKKGTQGRNSTDKVAVFGMLERHGKVKTQRVHDVSKKTLQTIIKKSIKKGTKIISDEWKAYYGLDETYLHNSVNHGAYQYVNGEDSTNNIEGYWSQLKRGIIGVYHSVSSQHMDKYCSEFDFRYNTRRSTEGGRFMLTLMKSRGCRLRLQDLTGK